MWNFQTDQEAKVAIAGVTEKEKAKGTVLLSPKGSSNILSYYRKVYLS